MGDVATWPGKWKALTLRFGAAKKGMCSLMFKNRFFAPPGQGDGELHYSGSLYAAIEVPELDNGFQQYEAEPVYLECIDTSWLVDTSWFNYFEQKESLPLWVKLFQKAPLSVLELTSYKLPPFPEGSRPGDIAWYEFGYELASSSESDARIYTNLISDGAMVRITFHEGRPVGWSESGPLGAVAHALAKYNSSGGSQYFIKERLAEVSTAGGVAFYDVGQGSCQAAIDELMHIPQLYIDFGGGVLTNKKTFPDSFDGFCFTRDPMIILSHWDWDHWSSAQRWPRALNTSWLTPPVPLKPIQLAFAAELYVRGSLHIWDDTWPGTITAGAVTIERCTGRTTNDSGLAVTLRRHRNSSRNCLLPGDADYAYIPSVTAGESFSVLCMTHHGGRLHSATYPRAKRGAISVLSAGPRNSYRHPLFDTVATHLEHGWGMPIGTALSGQRPCHVLVPWGGRSHIFQGGCHGGVCATAVSAIAPANGKIKFARQRGNVM